MEFEWDESKSRSNLQKHGISFEEAKSVFLDPLSLTIEDTMHSFDEERFISVGYSVAGRLLVVVYTERSGRIRIIGCRRATRLERQAYEEES